MTKSELCFGKINLHSGPAVGPNMSWLILETKSVFVINITANQWAILWIKKKKLDSGMVVHANNPSTWEAESSLGYIVRLSQNLKQNETNFKWKFLQG
jgi:hypothetical protein